MNIDDLKTIILYIGIFAGSYLLLLNWLRSRILKEEDLGVKRTNDLYNRIKSTEDNMHNCRRSLDIRINDITDMHMTELQVKDFVDRSIQPLKESIDSVKINVEKGNAMSHDLLSKVQVLLDRESQ